MERLSDVATRVLERAKQDHAQLTTKIRTTGARCFVEKYLAPLRETVPADVTVEQLTNHARWELAEAARRASLCARCPDAGGECAGESMPTEAGLLPVWVGDRLDYEPCAKWRAFAERRWLREAGVPTAFVEKSFDTFNADAPPARVAAEQCRAYASEVVLRPHPDAPAPTPRSLTLVGESGSGKSHLAVAILRALYDRLEHPPRIVFAYAPLFLDDVRRELAEYGKSPALDSAHQSDLLVLDDIGAERVTDFSRERLEALVHDRWSNARSMIVTQNCTHERLAETMGTPIVRRLLEASDVVVKL